MKKFFTCLIILCAAFSPAFAQQKKRAVRPVKPVNKILGTVRVVGGSVAPAPKLSPELQRRVEAFELTWQTLRDNYFDQTFNGLDWEKIRLEYRAKALKTTDDEQLHDLLQQMLKRLGRSHLTIIPPDVYREIEKVRKQARLERRKSGGAKEDPGNAEEEDAGYDALEFARFGIGVELRLINNQFVISRVESGSSAEKAGLKPGFVLEKINEASLSELLLKLQNWSEGTETIKKMLPLEIVAWFLNGEPETTVSIVYLDEKEVSKQISLKREKLSGEIIQLGSDFPDQFLSFESKSINPEVGYVKFNLFGLKTIELLCQSLTDLKDKKAIIIDLRGNTGGLFAALYGISGMLSDKPLELGTQIYKVGSETLRSSPKAKNFKGRIVFLTDSLSVSSAEVLASALQENNRAIIVGEKSAGEALPSLSVALPTGAVLIYPFANYKTPKGNLLEGIGVVPDVTVALSRKSLLEGRDSQIEAALRAIGDDKMFDKPKEKPAEVVGITDDDDEPSIIVKPTPKPIGAAPPQIIRSLSVAPPNTENAVETKDAKAVQVIDEFIRASGGEEELKKIETYQINGYAQMSIRGATVDTDVSIYRQRPDKYAVVWKSPALGETREVYTDKGLFVQNDFGLERTLEMSPNLSLIEIYAPIFNVSNKAAFSSLKYLGEFERPEGKAHVVEGKTSLFTVTMAFDSKTKMLVGYSSPIFTIFLDDYRPVGKVLLPFSVLRGSLIKILVTDVKLNQKIEESAFNKKENCFDRTN